MNNKLKSVVLLINKREIINQQCIEKYLNYIYAVVKYGVCYCVDGSHVYLLGSCKC